MVARTLVGCFALLLRGRHLKPQFLVAEIFSGTEIALCVIDHLIKSVAPFLNLLQYLLPTTYSTPLTPETTLNGTF
jgi:hypothetical protein